MAEKVIRPRGPWVVRQPTLNEYVASHEPADISALQALHRGEANPDQQKRALDWILTMAAGTYQECYHPGPDGERDTLYALGRAYVGRQILTLLSVGLSKLSKVKHD